MFLERLRKGKADSAWHLDFRPASSSPLTPSEQGSESWHGRHAVVIRDGRKVVRRWPVLRPRDCAPRQRQRRRLLAAGLQAASSRPEISPRYLNGTKSVPVQPYRAHSIFICPPDALAEAMGNNPSRATTPTSNPQSPASATASHGSATVHPSHSVRREPRRRESIQALSNVKATAAPPSASLESATAHSSTVSQHSRSRSQTTSAALVTPQLRAHDVPLREKPALEEKMGNDQSREKLAREPTPPPARPSPLTKPVDVPAPSAESHNRFESAAIGPAVSSQEAYYIPPSQSQYTRPPRLPLPIEEEVHTPGSPIISPADLSAPLDPVDVDSILPRRSSVLSSTTVDDDDLGDGLLHADEAGARPAVSTLIERTQGGDRVYVTGTFAGNWDRKYRLHKE